MVLPPSTLPQQYSLQQGQPYGAAAAAAEASAAEQTDVGTLQIQLKQAQRELAKVQHEAGRVPALQATAHAAAARAVQLERQLDDSKQHNAALQLQLAELQETQERGLDGQAAGDEGNGSALQQQLAEARREAATYCQEAVALRRVGDALQCCSAAGLKVVGRMAATCKAGRMYLAVFCSCATAGFATSFRH